MILAVGTNFKNNTSNLSFGHRGRAAKEPEEIQMPKMSVVMSKKTERIFRDLDDVICAKWTKYRKSKDFVPGTCPEFKTQKVNKTTLVDLKIACNDPQKYILEVHKGSSMERIILDKNCPDKFIYEQVMKTEKGGALTLKRHNSIREYNDDMTRKIYGMYDEYLPLFSGTRIHESKLVKSAESKSRGYLVQSDFETD